MSCTNHHYLRSRSPHLSSSPSPTLPLFPSRAEKFGRGSQVFPMKLSSESESGSESQVKSGFWTSQSESGLSSRDDEELASANLKLSSESESGSGSQMKSGFLKSQIESGLNSRDDEELVSANLRKLSKLILPPLGVSSYNLTQINNSGRIISPMDSRYRSTRSEYDFAE